MMVVRIFAYIFLALSVVGATMSMNDPYLIAPTASMAVAGVLMLAVDKVISLLSDIKEGVSELAPENQARKAAAAKMAKFL